MSRAERKGQTETASPASGRVKKPATLYDAVTGRVGYEGFLTDREPSKYRDRASTTSVAIPPDEVLFRRKGAPARFAEADIYEADRHLTANQSLPDSDVLKTIHTYVADFYDRTYGPDSVDMTSMDETALLAIGILLEEAAADVLGTTGDLAFAESSIDARASDTYWHNGQAQRSVIDFNGKPGRGIRGGDSDRPKT
ncbi:hypothetical protein LTR56_016511 [Elasticomyces elasticus]|nr:hypothetical protein LTR22_021910 [Elasticomyces elasticus]KAK3632143.1 hypothetical protein LTR56_016511 [Elasticomyces elasticus]KAK4923715.1 hypothetical protein LTR49_009072 [Elasticomyces elasticus]KAK5757520.1 hypothetical protein LTS12_012339 [Elasticomyces elasticus]